MTKIPRIISVDDHVVEPPDLWTSRLPSKYADRCPRVERDSAVFNFEGGVFSYEKGVKNGSPCDWWLYDDLIYPFPKLSAAVGFENLDVQDSNEINIKTKNPEFLDWKWIKIAELPKIAVNFKIELYKKIKEELDTLKLY